VVTAGPERFTRFRLQLEQHLLQQQQKIQEWERKKGHVQKRQQHQAKLNKHLQCMTCSWLVICATSTSHSNNREGLDTLELLTAAAQSSTSTCHVLGLSFLPGIATLADPQAVQLLYLCLQGLSSSCSKGGTGGSTSGVTRRVTGKLQQLLEVLGPRHWAVAAVHKLIWMPAFTLDIYSC
jgi:hypothetical protein